MKRLRKLLLSDESVLYISLELFQTKVVWQDLSMIAWQLKSLNVLKGVLVSAVYTKT